MIHVDPALVASDPPPAPARALVERQLSLLTRLADIGMEIAEACGREAKAAPSAGEAHAIGLVFARVARAVRMTIALQSRLAKDLAALDRAETHAEAARKSKRRMRLSLVVEEAARAAVAAQRQAGRQYRDEDAAEDEIEQLSSEAYERLTDAEDGEFTGCAVHEVAAGIVKDLGLSPDWTARLLAATAAPLPPPPSWGRWPPKGVGGGEVEPHDPPDADPQIAPPRPEETEADRVPPPTASGRHLPHEGGGSLRATPPRPPP
jgi:hypothetical protein